MRDLLNWCKIPNTNQDDPAKATQTLEVLALQIQMYTAEKNNKKLKELYEKAMQVKAAIAHPRILGVVYECGGKMFLREQEYKKAEQAFFEAFKRYFYASSVVG